VALKTTRSKSLPKKYVRQRPSLVLQPNRKQRHRKHRKRAVAMMLQQQPQLHNPKRGQVLTMRV
jgi:hypothetical protein